MRNIEGLDLKVLYSNFELKYLKCVNRYGEKMEIAIESHLM